MTIRDLWIDEIEAVAGGVSTARALYTESPGTVPDTKGGYDVPCGMPHAPVVLPPLPTDLPDRLPLLAGNRFSDLSGRAL